MVAQPLKTSTVNNARLGVASRLPLLGLLVLAAALSGCAAASNIRTDSAPGVDFGQFCTFSFYSPLSTDRAGFHTLVSQQLMGTRREMDRISGH